MKSKIIEILERTLDYKPHIITGIEQCADEILREERDFLMSFRKYFNEMNYGHIDESDIDGFLDMELDRAKP